MYIYTKKRGRAIATFEVKKSNNKANGVRTYATEETNTLAFAARHGTIKEEGASSLIHWRYKPPPLDNYVENNG